MDEIQLLIGLHKDGMYQGPGGKAETRQAMRIAGLDRSRHLRIADIGCGTGASTLLLAQELDAEITAVDFLSEFLETLEARATEEGVSERITTLNCSMEALPFSEAEYDVIWSEGAVYTMGFQAGVSAWKHFLKPNGIMVLSEMTWLSESRPHEIQAHWDAEYPEIDVASAKIKILEQNGFCPEGYFVLPKSCWVQNYYKPMESRFSHFLKACKHSEAAEHIVELEKNEIALFEKYGDYYGYGVYIARKL